MRDRLGVIPVAAALFLLGLAAIGLPVFWAVFLAARDSDVFAPLRTDPGLTSTGRPEGPISIQFFSWVLTARSLATALGIGLGATVIGWPLAWLLRTRGWRFLPLVATPLLLPNYLAFGAYNLLRAPGSTLGDWLERAARGDSGWIPVLAGKLLAGTSLILWSAPLAAMVLAIWLGRIENATLEQLSLDIPKRTFGRTLLVRSRLALPGLVAAIGLVSLLMLGSAIPLHVARLETLTIRVWLAMDLMPTDRQWRAWVVAWPVLVLAVVGAWLIARFATENRSETEQRTGVAPESVRGFGLAIPAAIFAAGALVPLYLFASHLAAMGGVGGLSSFLRVYREQIATSAKIAGFSGAMAGAMMLAAWIGMLAGGWARFLVRASAFLFAFGAIAPGVMLGVWLGVLVRQACPSFSDTPAILVLANLARFGIVPVALGCWLASGESQEQADQRRIDGATGFVGLLRTAIAANWPGLMAGSILVAVLSFHEIESAIVLQPPGVDTLARAILNQLHFARTQEMSAAGILLLGVGFVLGGTTLWWLGRVTQPSRASRVP